MFYIIIYLFLVEATVSGTRWLGVVAWGWDRERPGVIANVLYYYRWGLACTGEEASG